MATIQRLRGLPTDTQTVTGQSDPAWVDSEFEHMTRRLAAGQTETTSDATTALDIAQALADRFPADRGLTVTVEHESQSHVYYVRLVRH